MTKMLYPALITNKAIHRDPTQTATLRRAYAHDFKRRWGEVKRAARQRLVEDDALGLRSASALSPSQRASTFSTWLNLTITREVSRDWQHAYLRKGYRRGVMQAEGDLQKAGKKTGQAFPTLEPSRVFLQPIHAEEIALVEGKYDRDLENIQGVVVSQATRQVSDALSQQWTPEEAYTAVADRVDKVGNTRTKVLALTAIIDAVALGTLNRLTQVGIQRVSLIPEVIFTTAGDSKVCKFCQEWQGRSYDVFSAKGVIPLHAGCRCRWTLDLGFLLAQLGLIEVLTDDDRR